MWESGDDFSWPRSRVVNAPPPSAGSRWCWKPCPFLKGFLIWPTNAAQPAVAVVCVSRHPLGFCACYALPGAARSGHSSALVRALARAIYIALMP